MTQIDISSKFKYVCYLIFIPEMTGTSKQQSDYDNDVDDAEQAVYGSAEDDKMENKLENRAYASDNTVHGHVGLPSSSASSPPPTMKIIRRRPTPMTGSPYGVSSSASAYQHFLCHISLMFGLCVMINRINLL